MRYHELAPAAALGPYVQCYAEFVVLEAPSKPYLHVVIPDGCAHLSYLRPATVPGHSLMFTGPRMVGAEYPMAARQTCWDVKLRPHGLTLLGLQPTAWVDRAEPVGLGLPRLAAALVAGLDGCDDAEDARLVLDKVLGSLLSGAAPIDRLVAEAVSRIEASDGQLAISDVASGLSISERQFQRRFRAAVGLTPKQFSRIRRFRACARNMIAERPEEWGRVATAYGFSDQAHLTREFATLSGRPPTTLERYIALIEHGEVEP